MILHVVYGLAIACLASVAVWYWQQNQRMKKVERAATVLLADEAGDESRISRYSDEGFIQASLAFLEKNRDLYPDSYSRAQDLCKLNHCLDATYVARPRRTPPRRRRPPAAAGGDIIRVMVNPAAGARCGY
jgi:hypothetical protein